MNTDLRWWSIKGQTFADIIAVKIYLFCFKKLKRKTLNKGNYSFPPSFPVAVEMTCFGVVAPCQYSVTC